MAVEPTFVRSISAHEPAPPGTAAAGATEPAWLRNRAELRLAVRRFARALAAPADEPAWSSGLAQRLAALREQLTEHVVVTEGPDGLYAELLEHAPRLTRPVAALIADHGALLVRVDSLTYRLHRAGPDLEAVRRSAGELLVALAQHRQRGADLVYEAYATDIGGET